jgi:hypothetical protein
MKKGDCQGELDMHDDEQARHERAERLRKRIEQLKSGEQGPKEEDSPEMKPGESPKEYVERRMRETAREKSPKH